MLTSLLDIITIPFGHSKLCGGVPRKDVILIMHVIKHRLSLIKRKINNKSVHYHYYLFNSNGLNNYHGLSDNTHISIVNDRKLVLFHMKSPILFYGDGPAIEHGLPDIRHSKVNNGQ